jgi:hypothetical protein
MGFPLCENVHFHIAVGALQGAGQRPAAWEYRKLPAAAVVKKSGRFAEQHQFWCALEMEHFASFPRRICKNINPSIFYIFSSTHPPLSSCLIFVLFAGPMSEQRMVTTERCIGAVAAWVCCLASWLSVRIQLELTPEHLKMLFVLNQILQCTRHALLETGLSLCKENFFFKFSMKAKTICFFLKQTYQF